MPLVGTLWMIGIALVMTVPVGLVAAVYLDMTRSRPSRLFRSIVEAMTALPSILAGLFIYAAWILTLGFQRSGLAAALALSVMMLPYMIRAADLALRLVPGTLREASAALGAPAWRSELQVVIPTARSGLATAVILGIARGIGEASPVLLTAGFTSYMNANPLSGPMVSLPLEALKLVQSPAKPDLRDPQPSPAPRSCCWWCSCCSSPPARSADGGRATCHRAGSGGCTRGLGARRRAIRPSARVRPIGPPVGPPRAEIP